MKLNADIVRVLGEIRKGAAWNLEPRICSRIEPQDWTPGPLRYQTEAVAATTLFSLTHRLASSIMPVLMGTVVWQTSIEAIVGYW
jgi:hypothetical protein